MSETKSSVQGRKRRSIRKLTEELKKLTKELDEEYSRPTLDDGFDWLTNEDADERLEIEDQFRMRSCG